jgi:cell volume regulation protein A
MDAYADFFPDLLTVSLLLVAAIALTPLVRAARLPGPAAFLAVGIVAGFTDAIPTDGLGELPLEEIGAVALYAVLFQGGLSTGFGAWRREARPIVALGTAGTALTAVAVAAFGHYAIGLDWALAALVGVALSPTDPAAVYAMLRGEGSGPTRSRVILEGESGFNDPVSISLMVAVVAFLASDEATVGEGVIRFVEEMGIGVVGGLIGAAVLVAILRATPRLEDSLQSVAVLAGAVVIGAGTATLHGSGFLAVYLAGLLVADRWAAQDGSHHAIPEAAAATAEPVLFGLLGAVFASRVAGVDILVGLTLTAFTIAVVRPLVVGVCLAGSRLPRAERVIVSVGGLKGAVPLLLAGYAGLEGRAETRRTEAIVLAATTASIVGQGWVLAAVSSRSPDAVPAPTDPAPPQTPAG